MSLRELVQICPPPESPLDGYCDGRIEDIRQRYGLVLPEQYVEFGHTYGTGTFEGEDTHVISIFNPFSRFFHEDVEYGRMIASAFFLDQEPQRLLAQQRIKQEALFPLGKDDARASIYWVTDPSDNWRLLLFHGEWESRLEVFNCGLCDFLVGYFTGHLKVGTWEYRARDFGRSLKYRFE